MLHARRPSRPPGISLCSAADHTAARLPPAPAQLKLDDSGAEGAKGVLAAITGVQTALQGAQIAFDSYRTSRFFTVGLATGVQAALLARAT
jgi:hypothetical protein